jgi:hypothetical protein
MKENLIRFETAVLAKEQGFNIPVKKIYNEVKNLTKGINGAGKPVKNSEWGNRECYSAPTQALLQKWLRELHIIVVNAYANASGYCWESHCTPERGGSCIADSEISGPNESGCWDTYEQALEKGLFEALKLIK